jgi:hypothetical protein
MTGVVVSFDVAFGSVGVVGSFFFGVDSSKDAVDDARRDTRILLGLSSPSSSALRSAGVG